MDHSSKLLFTSIYNVVCEVDMVDMVWSFVTSVDICWIEPERSGRNVHSRATRAQAHF